MGDGKINLIYYKYVLHLWTFKTPILALKNLNDLNEEFILSIG
jgi:hypothetical protein